MPVRARSEPDFRWLLSFCLGRSSNSSAAPLVARANFPRSIRLPGLHDSVYQLYQLCVDMQDSCWRGIGSGQALIQCSLILPLAMRALPGAATSFHLLSKGA